MLLSLGAALTLVVLAAGTRVTRLPRYPFATTPATPLPGPRPRDAG